MDIQLKQFSSLCTISERAVPGPFYTRTKKIRAHVDDIHGLIPFQNGFISGSKDTSIAIWKANGELINRIQHEDQRGYGYWITALMPLNDDQWISGRRNGEIAIWDATGCSINVMFNTFTKATQCKPKNQARVNCLSKVIGKEKHFYTGHPQYIKEWDGETGEMIARYQAASNDWVYCIEPLSDRRLIVVFGSTLQIWDKNQNGFDKTTLVEEGIKGRKKKLKQRPHLSSICLLESDISKLATSVFDGSVRLVDLNTKETYCVYREHQGRAWSVINLAPNLLASSADDKTIKIWDVRQLESAATLNENIGRVSSLLRLTSEKFLSASCPNDPHASEEKATISFWELKKLTK